MINRVQADRGTLRTQNSSPSSSMGDRPMPADFSVFLEPEAPRINHARQDHLAALGLDLQAKRVLEVGAGIGLHTEFFEKRGCEVPAATQTRSMSPKCCGAIRIGKSACSISIARLLSPISAASTSFIVTGRSTICRIPMARSRGSPRSVRADPGGRDPGRRRELSGAAPRRRAAVRQSGYWHRDPAELAAAMSALRRHLSRATPTNTLDISPIFPIS